MPPLGTKTGKSSHNFKNWTGQQVGRWTVTEILGKDKFMCRCSCGTSRAVKGQSLRTGHSQSCGCLHKELLRQQPFQNLTGNRYGKLIVLGHAGVIDGDRRWRVQCDCGRIKVVRANSLRTGKTKSCGYCRDNCRDRLLTLYWLEKQLGAQALRGFKQARQMADISSTIGNVFGLDSNDTSQIPK